MSESFWKKEIRLGKPKAEKAETLVVQLGSEPTPAAERVPLLKRELSLKRKPKAENAAKPAPAPEAPKEKSRTLGRKRDELPPFPSHLLEDQRAKVDRPRGTVVVPVAPGAEPSDPVQRLERWSARIPAPVEKPTFPRPVAVEPEQQPPSLLPERSAPEPAPAFGAPPSSAPEAVSNEPDLVLETEPVSDTVPVSDTPVDVPAPVWSFSPPEPELETEQVSDTVPVSDTPVEEPTPAADTAVDEPETLVAQLDSEAAPVAEKVPLLKRELSFKRKPKTAKPPKARKEKKRSNPAAAAVAVAAVTAEKPPLLKRQLSLKRKPKEQKAASQPKQKRELRIPKPSLPKPSLKLGGRGDHKITNVVGLRIGSTQLAAAHIQNNGTHELMQLARTPLDRGLVVGGEVRDAETLTRALKEFFAANKLPKKDVRLGIASNRIGVRVLDVPPVDDPKAFENAIRFRAQELLPIPITDAILDHVVLGDVQGEDGGVLRRVLLVFAHRELVSRFVDVCRGAGVRLSGIDLDAFALLRAIGRASADADSSHAVVAVGIGHERTVLAVSDGTVCDFTRVLEWGGSSIDVAVARALNLTPSQAEPVKQMLDLESETPPDGLSPVQFEAAKSATRAEIGALGRELVSSLRFYQSRGDSLGLGEVLLTGGGAQLRGLPEELSRLLGVPVRVVDPLEQLTVNKKIELPHDAGSLAIAVGLGIEL